VTFNITVCAPHTYENIYTVCLKADTAIFIIPQSENQNKLTRTDACRRMASPDPRIKVHQIRERMSIGQTYNHAKFCGDPTCSVRDLGNRKFVLPKKLSKIHQNRLSPKPSPSCQISSRSVKPPWRKALQFFTPFNMLAPQGDKGHRSGWWGTPTPLYLQKFRPVPTTPLRDTCCQTWSILLPA